VGEPARLTLATGVVTSSHEAQHSRGIADEATGARLRSDACTEVAELPAYRSPGCREGGALDLRRADSIWR
jgi:hypothetical protein